MKQESQFIKNLRSIPFDESKLSSSTFESVRKANEFISQGKNKEASLLLLKDIETEIQKTNKETKDEISLKMLVISEIPNVDNDIRDLGLDIMLSIEEGELKNDDFILRINKIKARY